MWEDPQLIIGYEDDGRPAEAACSKCGARMLEDEPLPAKASEVIRAFTNAFHEHVRQKHPGSAPN